VRDHPDRFAAFATARRRPQGSADEPERTVTELGFKRSMVSSLTNGIVADDKRCWPMSGVFDTYPRLKIIIGIWERGCPLSLAHRPRAARQ